MFFFSFVLVFLLYIFVGASNHSFFINQALTNTLITNEWYPKLDYTQVRGRPRREHDGQDEWGRAGASGRERARAGAARTRVNKRERQDCTLVVYF